MHIGAQGLQRFLVIDPEALFFINDYKAKLLKAQTFGEQSVCADHDIDRAIGQPGLGCLGLLVTDQPR